MTQLNSKNKNKELIEEASQRLAEIFIIQIEEKRKSKLKKIRDGKEI